MLNVVKHFLYFVSRRIKFAEDILLSLNMTKS